MTRYLSRLMCLTWNKVATVLAMVSATGIPATTSTNCCLVLPSTTTNVLSSTTTYLCYLLPLPIVITSYYSKLLPSTTYLLAFASTRVPTYLPVYHAFLLLLPTQKWNTHSLLRVWKHIRISLRIGSRSTSLHDSLSKLKSI